MGCLIILLIFGMPRVALGSLWLFGDGYLGRAYDTFLVPLIGFLFFPFTTLAFAFASVTMPPSGSVSDTGWLLVGFSLLGDLGFFGGTYRHRRRSED